MYVEIYPLQNATDDPDAPRDREDADADCPYNGTDGPPVEDSMQDY